MICPICYHEGEPIKDRLESQGGNYTVLWWCYNCDCEATITSNPKQTKEGKNVN